MHKPLVLANGIRARLRTIVLTLTAVLCLAVPGSALASSFNVRVSANHSPVTNKNWWLTLYVTKGGQKLSGRVERYLFLYQGQQVSTQPAGNRSNHFGDFSHGYWRDNLLFPGESAGYHLTLVIVVHTKYGTQNIHWAVTPKK
jgi:hypothetical protein